MINSPDDGAVRGRGLSLWERFSREPKCLAAKKEIQERYHLPVLATCSSARLLETLTCIATSVANRFETAPDASAIVSPAERYVGIVSKTL